jgi:hypothetical protein
VRRRAAAAAAAAVAEPGGRRSYQNGFMSVTAPPASASWTVSVPPFAGTLYVQWYTTQPSSASYTPAAVSITVFYSGGGATSYVVNFTPLGTGWRLLGSWPFTGNGQEKIVVAPVNTGGSYLLMAAALRFTSYDPTCDIVDSVRPSRARRRGLL